MGTALTFDLLSKRISTRTTPASLAATARSVGGSAAGSSTVRGVALSVGAIPLIGSAAGTAAVLGRSASFWSAAGLSEGSSSAAFYIAEPAQGQSFGTSTAEAPSSFYSLAASDPNFSSVRVLLHGGSVEAGRFVNSANEVQPTYINGSAVESTEQSVFSSGKSISFPSPGSGVAAFVTGGGTSAATNWTIEAWVRPTAFPESSCSIADWGANPATYISMGATGLIELRLDIFGRQILAASPLSLNSWTHVAATKSGSVYKLFLNGALAGQSTLDATITKPTSIGIGGLFVGYMDEFRYTDGVARYTSSFAPPTAAFPDSQFAVTTSFGSSFGSAAAAAAAVGGAEGDGLLNPFYATTCYSMRRRNSGYAGPCVRVRNLTSGLETDIGFDVDGWCDALAIAATHTAGESVGVSTWYDQSGAGVHAAQATAGNRPLIVNAGSLVTMSGKPALDFASANDLLARLEVNAANGAFGYGTGAFSWEAFVETTSPVSVSGRNNPIINQRNTLTGADPAELYVTDSTLSHLSYYYGTNVSSGVSPAANRLHHLEMSYSGGTGGALSMYLNGSEILNTTATQNFGATDQLYIGSDTSGSWRGRIGEILVSKGARVHNAPFTPRRYAQPADAGSDPNFANVSLLLHMDGTNGGTTFSDSSNFNRTVSRFGQTNTSTAQAKFGASSAIFDGATDYLTFPYSTAFDFGTGNFTVEAWVYLTTSATAVIINRAPGTGFYPFQLFYNGSFVFRGFDSGNNLIYSPSSAAAGVGVWHHVAGVRSGNTFTVYLNGAAGQTATSSASVYQASEILTVGAYGTGANSLNGYIDEVRITKGVARYTANFTPPTTAFPDA